MSGRRRPTRPAQARPVDTIFLTGGIGDVIALEAYFSQELRIVLSSILYATRKSRQIEELFRSLPNYQSLRHHKVVWSDFDRFWCFLHKEECEARLGGQVTAELRDADDWGIMAKFPLIAAGAVKYTGSSFLAHSVADVASFRLPQDYVAVAPYSTDKRLGGRDFTADDWATVIAWLRRRGACGVVLNAGADVVPADGTLLDLSNRTTLPEAVEILKRGSGYVGIDSWLTPLAAKLFDGPNLAIKSRNSHCYDNKHIYFSPKKEFGFISTEIGHLLGRPG